MQTFTFDHEMRGRPKRCERCGAPTWSRVARFCGPCALGFGPRQPRPTPAEADEEALTRAAWALDLDAPIDGDADDGDDATETPFADQRLAELPPLNMPLRSTPAAAAAAAAAIPPSLRDQEDAAIWGRTDGDKPPFPLDIRCLLCCTIMTEYAQWPQIIRPFAAGYRCDAHSGSWRDFPPDGWDDRGRTGRPVRR